MDIVVADTGFGPHTGFAVEDIAPVQGILQEADTSARRAIDFQDIVLAAGLERLRRGKV
jgi:hypothetical protein